MSKIRLELAVPYNPGHLEISEDDLREVSELLLEKLGIEGSGTLAVVSVKL